MTQKKKYILVAVVLIGILAVTGISYAIWQLTKTQEGTNTLNSSCFKITFKDQDDITLQDAYPMSDEEGMKLTPYTFTITNVCETHASYQINLEVLNSTTFTDLTIMNISLNEKEAKGYSTYDASEKTLENASFSRKLENGYLYPLEEKTFTLRLWMDEDTPTEDAYMNQSFQSKVTIVTSYLKEAPTYAEVITNCSKNGYQTTECMLENSKYDTENLAYDETVDNNLRYIGSNPNNYVLFNNELWRIIGVMNNVEAANGNKDSRIKLIRDGSIGSYSWDSSSSNINNGYGINEWSQADLMKLLNPGFEEEVVGGSLYWNRNQGQCYAGANNVNTPCDFRVSGLLSDTWEMIEDTVWHTGSVDGRVNVHTNTNVMQMYNFERSENTGKIASGNRYTTDSLSRSVTWIGKIGLPYLSDWGYAVKENENVTRTTCLSSATYNWNTLPDCYENVWLSSYLNQNERMWSISPAANTSNNVDVFGIYSSLTIRINALEKGLIFPTLYLKKSVIIYDGDGSSTKPYHLKNKP